LGCLQREEDYDETFSPAVDFTTVRIALALAVHEKMHVHHVDVTGAFLFGDLEEELYMSLPPGFGDSEHPDYVCKLKKSLYGLKQSPRIWHQHLCSYLASLRFRPVSHTECVFEHLDIGKCVRMLVYVDDALIISSSLTLIARIKTELKPNL
jgi:Reverse transcriptase (RNA-dependent DNA polymerase)